MPLLPAASVRSTLASWYIRESGGDAMAAETSRRKADTSFGDPRVTKVTRNGQVVPFEWSKTSLIEVRMMCSARWVIPPSTTGSCARPTPKPG